jgi:5,10-methylenetetrahydromethanopterin reductase
MEKTGFAMGYDPSLSVRDMAALARQAEDRGFDMVFFSEALLCNRDSVTALAAFGLATSRIALGATG